jgi:hypothetical protein
MKAFAIIFFAPCSIMHEDIFVTFHSQIFFSHHSVFSTCLPVYFFWNFTISHYILPSSNMHHMSCEPTLSLSYIICFLGVSYSFDHLCYVLCKIHISYFSETTSMLRRYFFIIVCFFSMLRNCTST